MNGLNYLAIGSIVQLKKVSKKVMVIGYVPIDLTSKEQIYDYLGCYYPEGLFVSKSFGFSNSDIDKTIYERVIDEETKQIHQKLLWIDEHHRKRDFLSFLLKK